MPGLDQTLAIRRVSRSPVAWPFTAANTDGVRDIPDVSMFAANGVWGHYEIVCWSDPSQTSGGAASCSGAPSTWAGFGGTSVAAPSMAAVQALINQQTGQIWGNPNPIYYQIGQTEYGTAGGTFREPPATPVAAAVLASVAPSTT